MVLSYIVFSPLGLEIDIFLTVSAVKSKARRVDQLTQTLFVLSHAAIVADKHVLGKIFLTARSTDDTFYQIWLVDRKNLKTQDLHIFGDLFFQSPLR